MELDITCKQCSMIYHLTPRMYYKAKRKLCDPCFEENQSHRDRYVCMKRKDKPRTIKEPARKDRKEEYQRRKRSPHHNRKSE